MRKLSTIVPAAHFAFRIAIRYHHRSEVSAALSILKAEIHPMVLVLSQFLHSSPALISDIPRVDTGLRWTTISRPRIHSNTRSKTNLSFSAQASNRRERHRPGKDG
jgi:hypothetical protein